MTIQAFYKDVLTSMHYSVGKDNLISTILPDGTKRPAMVEDKRLVFPDKDVLREGISSDLVGFHPLCENIARKKASPVVEHMRLQFRAYTALYLMQISTKLLEIGATPSLQKNLPPSLTAMLKNINKADAKTIEVFDKLMEKASLAKEVVVIYLKNGGVLNGEKYNRLCSVTFPFAAKIESEEKPYGVTLRKNDKKVILELLYYVLPSLSDPTEYTGGSNSRVAPYFCSLVDGYRKVFGRFNHLLGAFSGAVDFEVKKVNLDFLTEMENLTKLAQQIPPLRGNDGTNVDAEATPAPAPTAAPKQGRPPAKEKPSASNVCSVDDFLKTLQPQPMQPMQQPQPQYSAYPNNPYVPQQPMMQQPQSNQPPMPYWLQQQQPQQQPSGFAQAFAPAQPVQQPMGFGQPQQQWPQQQPMMGQNPNGYTDYL